MGIAPNKSLKAGLFSGILTAFLAQSTDMLEPDLEEISTALLLSVAQSQWRIETGNQNQSLPMVNTPPFQPTTSARWINALWFMALAFSLGAAMMAMLAREWMREFPVSPSKHPYVYSVTRQARLDAFQAWHTTHIIDILPTLLHLSLVLFMVGLIIRLWLLDRVIATILAVASGIITIAYLVVVVLGSINQHCPYRTRASYYARKLLIRNEPAIPAIDNLKVLRALQWLARYARDQDVRNRVWGVLAKTRKWTSKPGQTANQRQGEASQVDQKIQSKLIQDFDYLAKSLKKYDHELNASPYAVIATTLPDVCYYLDHCLLKADLQISDSMYKKSKEWSTLRATLQKYVSLSHLQYPQLDE